jgi:lysine-N-methylase
MCGQFIIYLNYTLGHIKELAVMPTITAYQPQFYKNFACVSSKCGNTCCRSWRVDLTKRDCGLLMSVKDNGLRQKLAENIDVYSSDPFKAKFRMDGEGFCHFLTPDGLCVVHSSHGPEILPSICRLYPRMYLKVGDETEAFLSLSCEAAAKGILFGEGILKLSPEPTECSGHFNGFLETEKYINGENGKGKRGAETFWALRAASVYAVQNRRYPVWMRMFMLGIFIGRADGLLASGCEDEIPILCEKFMAGIEGGAFDGYADEVPDRPGLKIPAFFHLLSQADDKLGHKKAGDLFSVCVSQMREGLGVPEEETPGLEAADRYAEALERYYMPFLGNREYVMENYVANDIYFTGFPFTYNGKGSVYANYLRLASKYCALKFLLTGMAGHYKDGFGQKEVIDGVSAFTRTVDHRPGMVEAIIKTMEAQGLTSMARMCSLLKD